MKPYVLEKMLCPQCFEKLKWADFKSNDKQCIQDGIAWCVGCKDWYPIEDEILELLPSGLCYESDRQTFYQRHQKSFKALHLTHKTPKGIDALKQPQLIQQKHFDWYCDNTQQSYSKYHQTPFWKAVDESVFGNWKPHVKKGAWILDVGCAQGRSLLSFLDLNVDIVGIDISKSMLQSAQKSCQSAKTSANTSWIVGDASKLPFMDSSFDSLICYGVLHHLPKPDVTCREIARVLKPGGIYFGSENNNTPFRFLFDWLQRLLPLWTEEAGKEPLVSEAQLRQWFSNTGLQLDIYTHVFVPPHIINILGDTLGKLLLCTSDWIAQKIIILKKKGGLITTTGRKAFK